MSRAENYTDANGIIWISAAKVAEIWNHRAITEYNRQGHYTRWSVRQRESKLQSLQTPLGKLYREDMAKSIDLRPHSSKRPDVAKKNKERAKTE